MVFNHRRKKGALLQIGREKGPLSELRKKKGDPGGGCSWGKKGKKEEGETSLQIVGETGEGTRGRTLGGKKGYCSHQFY